MCANRTLILLPSTNQENTESRRILTIRSKDPVVSPQGVTLQFKRWQRKNEHPKILQLIENASTVIKLGIEVVITARNRDKIKIKRTIWTMP